MSPRVIDIFFCSAGVLIFGLMGFVPQIGEFMNKYAVITLSSKTLGIFQKIYLIVCVGCLCGLIITLLGAH